MFDDTIERCFRALDAESGRDALLSAFTIREVRLRGLLATGRVAAAVSLAEHETASIGPPTPQWQVIERITTAAVMARAGDEEGATTMLAVAVTDAEVLQLPHQIQRVIRLTRRMGRADGRAVTEHAGSALTRLTAQIAMFPAGAGPDEGGDASAGGAWWRARAAG